MSKMENQFFLLFLNCAFYQKQMLKRTKTLKNRYKKKQLIKSIKNGVVHCKTTNILQDDIIFQNLIIL